MKRKRCLIYYSDNWLDKLIYDVRVEHFYEKADRNISDDKRRNLKRKFRIQTRDWTQASLHDELKSREDIIWCESSDHHQATLKDVKANWGVEKITFKPKPLPG